VPLVPTGSDEYEATLPEPPALGMTEYYVIAVDETGRSEGMPRPAPSGWYSFPHRPAGVGVPPVTDPRERAVTPNPFRAVTSYSFCLDHPEHVVLDVIDAQGRLVRRIAAREFGAGESSVSWDGRDDGGRDVAAGTYYVRLAAAGLVHRTRVTRLR
jgi:hypothetical protein